jgi:hypothetical protein
MIVIDYNLERKRCQKQVFGNNTLVITAPAVREPGGKKTKDKTLANDGNNDGRKSWGDGVFRQKERIANYPQNHAWVPVISHG